MGRGRQPIRAKILMSTEGLITMVICCKLKRIFSISEFIYIFSWFNKCIWLQVRGRRPQGTKFWCQQKPLVTSVICYKFQKNLFEVCFYTFFFHDFIHVYSPGAGADNHLGTKFWWQQEHLVTSINCCKFQNNLFEVWIYTILFMTLYMYIVKGQGQKYLVTLFICCKLKKKCLWSLILYNFFMI